MIPALRRNIRTDDRHELTHSFFHLECSLKTSRLKSALSPFHLAIPVNDLESSRAFYGGVLQCEEGRSTDHWIDYDFFGHQFVVHVSASQKTNAPSASGTVDGKQVPIPHFGVVLGVEQWHQLADQLKKANVEFVIEPTIRFAGMPAEQATLFFLDPSGNALEFKAFADIETQLFAK
ncbi:VOC family protein [Neorhodopirellula lusitana]|nr:VOC family protein [Neorhodopirellula lusitana]